MRGALKIVMGVATVAACTDARDEFDRFGDRVPDAAPPIDGAIVSTLPDVTGEFFMVARPDLQEDRFLEFRVMYQFTPVTENTGRIAYTGWCLDRITHEPVGDPMSASDVDVRADGSFDAPMVGILYAECNSVAGNQIDVDGIVHGTLRSADFLCGDMSGSAGGLPLTGTTWGAQRITDALPSPIWRCEDAPAP